MTVQPPQRRLVLTLYRQFLRWSRKTDPLLPLTSLVEPIQLSPPLLDEDHGRSLAIRNGKDVTEAFRTIFRLNANSKQDTKEKISLAFAYVKILPELTVAFDELKDKRSKHLNREGISFRVGQVVQHKSERWRGIVIGWERSSDTEDRTSLTTKDYTNVLYRVLLDAGDRHIKQASGEVTAVQSVLQPMRHDRLYRIRSPNTDSMFQRFDDRTQLFIPNETLAYQYPMDLLVDNGGIDERKQEFDRAAATVVSSVQDLASQMNRIILDVSSSPADQGLSLLAGWQQRLCTLGEGPLDRSFERPDESLVGKHLRELLNIQLELQDVLQARRISTTTSFDYNVGDTVLHKVFGFRGVVVGRDPKPTVDVSNWDGLQHIANASDLPFYHVVPDQDDCVEAFAGERPLRYVCEDNLEPCPSHRRSTIDLRGQLDLSQWTYENGNYFPPEPLRFKYGIDLDDDGRTESSLTRVLTTLTEWQVDAREMSTPDTLPLFSLLRTTDNLNEALVIEEFVKETWKAHRQPTVRRMLDDGTAELLRGRAADALSKFESIVDEQDESYAEAWLELILTL